MRKQRSKTGLLLLLISLLFLFCACTPQEAAPDMAEAEPEKAVSEPGSAVAPEALAHPPVAGEAAIQWREPALEALVREKLGKPDGEIYPSELDYIWGIELVGDTHIYFNADGGFAMFKDKDDGYDTLRSMGYTKLDNPSHIDLRIKDEKSYMLIDNEGNMLKDGTYSVDGELYERGSIRSLADFAHFRSLRYLYVYKNDLQELSGLSPLEELIELVLTDNEIEDISVLTGLRQLRTLQFDANHVTDIESVRELEQLRFLHVRANDISDISVLAAMESLEWLIVSGNPIESIEALRGLSLKRLDIDHTGVGDLSPLREMNTLWLLGIEQLRVDTIDFEPLAGLDKLSALFAGQEQAEIVNIRSLAGLERLLQVELIPSDNIPEEDIQWLREQLPGCYFYL